MQKADKLETLNYPVIHDRQGNCSSDIFVNVTRLHTLQFMPP